MFQELAVLKNWAHSVQGQKTNKSRFWDLFYEAPVSFRLGKRRCTSMLSQIAMTWEFNRPQIRYLSKTLSAPIRIGVPLFLVHFLHLVNRGSRSARPINPRRRSKQVTQILLCDPEELRSAQPMTYVLSYIAKRNPDSCLHFSYTATVISVIFHRYFDTRYFASLLITSQRYISQIFPVLSFVTINVAWGGINMATSRAWCSDPATIRSVPIMGPIGFSLQQATSADLHHMTGLMLRAMS